MSNSRESVAANVKALMKKLYDIEIPMPDDIMEGKNPAIIAAIMMYRIMKTKERPAQRTPSDLSFHTMMSNDCALYWFYDQLNNNGVDNKTSKSKSADKACGGALSTTTTRLTVPQRRELLYTLYRYW